MITLTEVGKSFGSVQALDNVSLNFRPGDRVALIGHNGSGKTTLIRCIMGLMHFTGAIDIFGHHPRRSRLEALKLIGFVPQASPPLAMSIGELMKQASEIRGVDEGLVESFAKGLALDLSPIRGLTFRKLSGGMRHKLLLAIALAAKPPVLLLDEPTASLDPKGRESFLGLLRDIADKTIVLITSHRVTEFAGFINQIVEMDSGRVISHKLVEGDL